MNSHYLSKRPFSIKDGEFYIIVIRSKKFPDNIFTFRDVQENGDLKVAFELNDGKVFFNRDDALEALVEGQRDIEQMEYKTKISKIKDFFKPVYFIKELNPDISVDRRWVHASSYIGETTEDGTPNEMLFVDYNDAVKALNRLKSEATEYYYRKIMDLRLLEIKKDEL